MATHPNDPAAPEAYLVAPHKPGPEGMEALTRLNRVRAMPGGQAELPRPVPGLAAARPRLRVTLPRGSLAALQAEFGGQLLFEPDAELRY